MIDFRYHLVSIVAVFLALAIGLVVGSTALNGPLTTRACSAPSEPAQHRRQPARAEQPAGQPAVRGRRLRPRPAPRLLGGLLPGEHVVLVIAPGADGAVVTGVTHRAPAGRRHRDRPGRAEPAVLRHQRDHREQPDRAGPAAGPGRHGGHRGATQQGGDPQCPASEAAAVLAAALLDQEAGRGAARPDPASWRASPSRASCRPPGHDQRGHAWPSSSPRPRRPRPATATRPIRAALADREAERRRARYGAGRLIPGRIRAWQRHRRADQRSYRNSGVQRG